MKERININKISAKEDSFRERRMIDTDSEEWKEMAAKFGKLPVATQGGILREVESQKVERGLNPTERNELFKSLINKKYKEDPIIAQQELDDSIVQKFDKMTGKDSDRVFKNKPTLDESESSDLNYFASLSADARIERAEKIINKEDSDQETKYH